MKEDHKQIKKGGGGQTEELTSENKRINNDKKNNKEIVQRLPDLVGGRFPVTPQHAAVWTDSQVDCTILLELCGVFYFKSVLAVIPSRLKLDVFLLHYLLHSSFSLLLAALLLHLLRLSSPPSLLCCP